MKIPKPSLYDLTHTIRLALHIAAAGWFLGLAVVTLRPGLSYGTAFAVGVAVAVGIYEVVSYALARAKEDAERERVAREKAQVDRDMEDFCARLAKGGRTASTKAEG